MFQVFLLKSSSRKITKYLEKLVLYDPTHMNGIVDPMIHSTETSKIEGRCSLEKEFTKLICMNL